MPEVSLKITIAGRTYPITVQTNERENVLKAASVLSEEIIRFEKEYDVRDKQDLLAMAALKIATLLVELKDKHNNTEPTLFNQLEDLHHLINRELPI
ncbi:MAG: cell division protein ZapA [Flavobacteriales bacterium]|nr:cell division protein ZapA [Flavobacteriales bacterium]